MEVDSDVELSRAEEVAYRWHEVESQPPTNNLFTGHLEAQEAGGWTLTVPRAKFNAIVDMPDGGVAAAVALFDEAELVFEFGIVRLDRNGALLWHTQLIQPPGPTFTKSGLASLERDGDRLIAGGVEHGAAKAWQLDERGHVHREIRLGDTAIPELQRVAVFGDTVALSPGLVVTDLAGGPSWRYKYGERAAVTPEGDLFVSGDLGVHFIDATTQTQTRIDDSILGDAIGSEGHTVVISQRDAHYVTGLSEPLGLDSLQARRVTYEPFDVGVNLEGMDRDYSYGVGIAVAHSRLGQTDVAVYDDSGSLLRSAEFDDRDCSPGGISYGGGDGKDVDLSAQGDVFVSRNGCAGSSDWAGQLIKLPAQ